MYGEPQLSADTGWVGWVGWLGAMQRDPDNAAIATRLKQLRRINTETTRVRGPMVHAANIDYPQA